MAPPIRSRNDFFQRLESVKRSRAKRREWGECFVESVAALDAAVRVGWPIRTLVHAADRPLSGWARDVITRCPEAEVRAMDPELLAELSDRVETSELVATAALRPSSLRDLPRTLPLCLLLLDRPSSPGNLGSMLRSSNAFGATGVVIRGHATDVWDPLSIRASLGAVFTTPLATDMSNRELTDWLQDLRAGCPDLQLIGASPHASLQPGALDFRRSTVLVLGNEKTGMSASLRELVDQSVAIPTVGSVDSLNVAAAAAVLLYEISRQRAPSPAP